MLIIDGSFGEGGGQIVRTALALSAVTRTPVTINNIRHGRPKPGLQIQHITGARALAEICGGKLKGDELYSVNLTFEPGEVKAGSYEFDVTRMGPSAGSTSLIMQQLLPALMFAKDTSYVVIKGGTDVPFAPPAEFIENTFIPTLKRMGIEVTSEVKKWGFYPAGGGEIKFSVKPLAGTIKPLEIKSRGKLKKLECLAISSDLPGSVTEREDKQAKKLLDEAKLNVDVQICKHDTLSSGPGNVFLVFADYENTSVGFAAYGEFGKPAEKVAGEAIAEFLKFNSGPAAVGKYLADQLLIYLALSEGPGSILTSEITPHIKTNAWVIEQFLPVKFEISGNSIDLKKLAGK